MTGANNGEVGTTKFSGFLASLNRCCGPSESNPIDIRHPSVYKKKKMHIYRLTAKIPTANLAIQQTTPLEQARNTIP